MIQHRSGYQTNKELVEAFKRDESRNIGIRLQFEGVGDKDVYNITAPFRDNGELILAGRVEGRTTEWSNVLFFRRQGEVWTPHPDYPVYDLQDPFFTRMNGELIFGGVGLIKDSFDSDRIVSWETRFYRGPDALSLKPFLTGPDRMKDIRLIELSSGEVGVLSRPGGLLGGGPGSVIGFTKVSTLDDITAEIIASAPTFGHQFSPQEWGGANEAHLLGNGFVGVLGHIAEFDGFDRRYRAMTFAINPETSEISPMKIIAMRSNFPAGVAKRPDLADVVFSGGLVRKSGGLADLFVGASDAEAYRIEIEDPFLEYERL
ncbi:DUF1861 family protein [Cohnella terricola]|uniref:DUF1861 family protein n=1 Tax=Cohnella terricola TaxID=1289167 RepID=A0A559JEF9_9BACL|nr:DUF1861 family protein [Cohnella terricola]TVX98255.1 DUF1861 family protein [Cohnella terricola]